MLAACGVSSVEEFFAQIPADERLNRPLDLAPGLSEYEIVDFFKSLSDTTAVGYASFLGAGVYNHYRPTVVDTVVSRGEFLTSYTPYQSEISQGTLVTIFEFQTMLCQLTGMDVANASMYDASTAVPEAAMMAVRVTHREKILVARSVHPEYRAVQRTYARNLGLPIEEFGYDSQTGEIDLADLESKIDKQTACVMIQSPNFFGVIENVRKAAEIAHAHGALLVFVFAEAVSLCILEPPRDAYIVVGELQSFAISPRLRRASTWASLRPKRSSSASCRGVSLDQTVDTHGNRAFCSHSRRARTAHPPGKVPLPTSAPIRRSSPSWPRFLWNSTVSRDCANWPSRIWPKRITSAPETQTPLLRTILQRVHRGRRRFARSRQQAASGQKNNWRPASRPLLSGTRGLRPPLRHRNDQKRPIPMPSRRRSGLDNQGPLSSHSERRPDLREEFARQNRLSVAAARRPRS